MTDLEEIISGARVALDNGLPEKALEILGSQAFANNGDVLFLKGEIYFKLQQWGEALNQFSRFLEKFPDDSKAQSYCQMIRNILGFYHKDLYNP